MAFAGRFREWFAGVPVGRMPVACVLVVAVVAACGGAGGTDEAAQHDDADVAFATGMIPHHRQAVVMADLAATRAVSPTVKQLATQISAEQMPEIAQLQWALSGWGSPVPATANTADMPGMPGMSGMTAVAPGIMSDQQMAQLIAASGPAFDQAFLQMMIRHHGGGIAMARTELSEGRDPDAMLMAQNISDAQEAAITYMQQLLARS